MEWKFFLLISSVFFANIIQGITGFAGTILAMPFSIVAIGFHEAKFVLNFISILNAMAILFFEYKKVNIKELGVMLGYMFLGALLGFFLVNAMDIRFLLKVFPLVVIAISVYNLLKLYGKIQNKNSGELRWFQKFLIVFFAGVIHGAFIIGGPLLVIYATYALKNKTEFRATLSAVWLILNSVIMPTIITKVHVNAYLILLASMSAAFMFLGTYIGNILHKKVSQLFFLKLTHMLLIFSGLYLLII